MDKKVAVLWCQALKSGKFKKNPSTLCSMDGTKLSSFGVLCEISGCGVFEKSRNEQFWFFHPFIECESKNKPNGGEIVFLPKCVLEWSKIKTNMGELYLGLNENERTNILRLNRDYDFQQMAEFIKNNYQWL